MDKGTSPPACEGAVHTAGEAASAPGRTEDELHPVPGSMEDRTASIVAAGSTSRMGGSPPETSGNPEGTPESDPGRVMG